MIDIKRLERKWFMYKIKKIFKIITLIVLFLFLLFIMNFPQKITLSEDNSKRDQVKNNTCEAVSKCEENVVFKEKIVYRDKIIYQQKEVDLDVPIVSLDKYFLNHIQSNMDVYDMWRYFQDKNYKQSCIDMGKYVSANYSKSMKNENILNFYAYSCLKAGYISMLKTPIVKLNHSSQARANALYFTNIFFLKKLVYPMIVDGIKMKNVVIPNVKHYLYDVFKALQEEKYTVINDRIIIKIDDLVYKIYQKRTKSKVVLHIKIYDKSKLIKTRKIY